MWMRPTGLPASTTNIWVILRSFMMRSTSAASEAGSAVRGALRHHVVDGGRPVLPEVRWRRRSPSVTRPASRAVCVGDGRGRRSLSPVIVLTASMKGVPVSVTRELGGGVHHVGGGAQHRAELSAGMEDLEVVGLEALALEQGDGERIAQRDHQRGGGGGGVGFGAGFGGVGHLQQDVGGAAEASSPPWPSCRGAGWNSAWRSRACRRVPSSRRTWRERGSHRPARSFRDRHGSLRWHGRNRPACRWRPWSRRSCGRRGPTCRCRCRSPFPSRRGWFRLP